MISAGKSQGDGEREGREARVVQSLRDRKRVSEVAPPAPHPPPTPPLAETSPWLGEPSAKPAPAVFPIC